MKIRRNFVSNSSSESFICNAKFTLEETRGILQKILDFYNDLNDLNLSFDEVFEEPRFCTQDDLELLTRLYPDTVTDELAKRFGRSAGSVKTKARQLGLKKSQSYLKTIKSRPRKKRKKKT